ncbi:glutamyl-tRNA reductase [Pseudaeromonas paramecii]|uniref:Glutamyl-tRNA reductase n=1 Tax=Pseudaeromonas paramecii TaxID=2138166 RepID=A0ABP8Q3Q9_9GAMM
MQLLVLGVNHTSASLSLRERLTFGPEMLSDALPALLAQPGVAEAAILSTCNRTELYCCVQAGAAEGVRRWLGEYQKVNAAELEPALYQHLDGEAVRHLMRVACGLDSLVLGEPQILGQLKQALASAREQGAIRALLGRLLDRTFSVAKRVRTETGIGAHGVSVAYVAVSLARQIFADLAKLRVLLIGAGETIELVGKHLVAQGATGLTVANRTLARAQAVAGEWGADVITLNEIPEVLPQVDLVISSTASPLPILGKGLVERALKQRRHRPMLLIDLAVPRDVEPEVAELADAYLYAVDDLQSIIEENQSSRLQAARQAELLIGEARDDFMAWFAGLDSQVLIRRFRDQGERWQQQELARALQALAQGEAPAEVLSGLAHRLTHKLQHHPTAALREAAQRQDSEALALLSQALGLESH